MYYSVREHLEQICDEEREELLADLMGTGQLLPSEHGYLPFTPDIPETAQENGMTAFTFEPYRRGYLILCAGSPIGFTCPVPADNGMFSGKDPSGFWDVWPIDQGPNGNPWEDVLTSAGEPFEEGWLTDPEVPADLFEGVLMLLDHHAWLTTEGMEG